LNKRRLGGNVCRFQLPYNYVHMYKLRRGSLQPDRPYAKEVLRVPDAKVLTLAFAPAEPASLGRADSTPLNPH